MYIVKCKGKWKNSGQYNRCFSTTLIKTQVFTALRRDTEIAEKLNFVPWFQNQDCSKLNTSLTLEPNVQKLYNYILSHIFHIFTRKKGPLPITKEYSQIYLNIQIFATLWYTPLSKTSGYTCFTTVFLFVLVVPLKLSWGDF